MISLEISSGVAVSLEGTIDNVTALINKIWHNWLVLRTIPRNISWLSDSVSVTGLVVLVEHWSLSGSPLSVYIWDWWVLWKYSCQVPPEEVWIVDQGSVVELVSINNKWSLVSESSSKTLRYEEHKPKV